MVKIKLMFKLRLLILKLDEVAMLIANSPQCNSTNRKIITVIKISITVQPMYSDVGILSNISYFMTGIIF